MNNIINMIGFQLGWWLCIIGVKNNLFFLGPVYMLIFILFHLFFISNYKNELILIIFGSFIGIIIDGYLKYSNLVNYYGDSNSPIIAPLWIISMWAGFCTTINHSLSWLKKSLFSSYLLGTIFGPLSYLTGQKLGVILFEINYYTLIILSLFWGTSILLLFYFNKKMINNGF